MYELLEVSDAKILFVMAADAEYGEQLRARIKPLLCGVGPVEAAVSLSMTLSELSFEKSLPDLVVSLGSAGSDKLEQTKIYQTSSVSYRDMDASPLGFEKGKTPFLDLPAEIPMLTQLPDIPNARLSTGANIISGAAYHDIDADMVDMETFSILRVCQSFQIPLIALRGISDGKEELTHISDWTEYLHVIDANLAEVVDEILRLIGEGMLKANS